jgi:DNA-binding MarR family transcriptional regulator
MTQTVADLEADGYVQRHPDPDDGRRALVELTDAGLSDLQADRRHREGWLASALDELTDADRAVVARAVEILGRLDSS